MLTLATDLERYALSDTYFISRNLYPNVDFYSGVTLKALGFSKEMFTAIFVLSRTVGWLAHWQEQIKLKGRLWRPRQIYVGNENRDINV